MNAGREKMVAELGKAGIQAASGGGGNFVCIRVPEGSKVADFVQKLE